MKILMIAPEFAPAVGGMEVHARKTAELLSGMGHDLLVLAPRHRHSPPIPAAYAVQRPLTRSFRHNVRCIDATRRTFQPDVLLIMNAGFAPAVARANGGVPPVLVRTAGNDAYAAWHGPRLPLRFLFWRLPARRPDSMGSILRRVDQERRVRSVIASLSRCNRVLCNSSYSLARLRDLGVPADRLRLLVGGVDVKAFAPLGPASAERRPLRRPQVLGVAGSLKPIKGIDVALGMLPLLSGSASGAVLRVAGIGPEEAHLRALAGELGVENRVEFLGSVPLERMPGFYQSLDLYLQPSVEIRHEASGTLQAESMGRALCEAQSSGVPVVASRSGGIPDVVQEGASGRLVPPGDPGALARAVESCLAEPEILSRMGQAGRRLAVERFSWEVLVSEMHRAISEVTAVRRAN